MSDLYLYCQTEENQPGVVINKDCKHIMETVNDSVLNKVSVGVLGEENVEERKAMQIKEEPVFADEFDDRSLPKYQHDQTETREDDGDENETVGVEDKSPGIKEQEDEGEEKERVNSEEFVNYHNSLQFGQCKDDRTLTTSYSEDLDATNESESGNMTPENVGQHVKTEVDTQSAQESHHCSECSSSFTKAGSLRRHMRSHSQGILLTCLICRSSFRISNFATPVWPHVVSYPVCTKCSQVIASNEETGNEIITADGQRVPIKAHCLKLQSAYTCTVCNNSFRKARHLKNHIRAQHKVEWKSYNSQEQHNCSICSKSFTCARYLTKHMKTHSGHNCPLCSQSFSLSYSLKRHMRTHTEDKRPHCSVCGKSFKKPERYAMHMLTHHASQHICPKCAQLFTDAETLLTHMKTHSPDKQHWCLVCKKSFISSTRLETHMKSHTGEKPHCCNICGKLFAHKNKLAEHTRTHTGEKPYSCSLCDKSFAKSYALKAHMSTHTGDKPHKCPFCSKSFTLAGRLTVHIRTHTGEKPYSCSVCAKTFRQLTGMKTHMRTHTGERPYGCTVCSMSFTTSGNLKTHMKTHKECPNKM